VTKAAATVLVPNGLSGNYIPVPQTLEVKYLCWQMKCEICFLRLKSVLQFKQSEQLRRAQFCTFPPYRSTTTRLSTPSQVTALQHDN
jgi:hypothetical protein